MTRIDEHSPAGRRLDALSDPESDAPPDPRARSGSRWDEDSAETSGRESGDRAADGFAPGRSHRTPAGARRPARDPRPPGGAYETSDERELSGHTARLDHRAPRASGAREARDPGGLCSPAWLSGVGGGAVPWYERVVPERFRGTRWDPGPRGVVVLAVVAALAVLLAGFAALREEPEVYAVPPISPPASAGPVSAAAQDGSFSAYSCSARGCGMVGDSLLPERGVPNADE
ncbi:hypothetical protein ABZ319_11765, partial [Nocardia sp. NPDC005978]